MLAEASRNGYTRAFVKELRAAADDGDCDALNTLAMFHRDEECRSREGVLLIRKDERAALQYNQRAAALGDTSGMVSVAGSLSRPSSRPRDLAGAERLYRKAFRLGNSTAAFNLAVTYQNLGRCAEAVHWFRRALDAGDQSAELELARAELYGVGTRRNVPSAVARLQRVANGLAYTAPIEQTDAMLLMADALRYGWLLRRDYKVAMQWLRRAARLGSDAAKGLLLEEGFEVA